MAKVAAPVPAQKTFSLLVDKVPYEIKIVPFPFNNEQRFYVRINGGPEHVFTWDSEIKRLRAIDDGSSIMPDNLEAMVSRKIEQSLG